MRQHRQMRMLQDCRGLHAMSNSTSVDSTKCCHTKKCIGIDSFLELKRPCPTPCGLLNTAEPKPMPALSSPAQPSLMPYAAPPFMAHPTSGLVGSSSNTMHS